MKTIWKYDLDAEPSVQTIHLPVGAEFIAAEMQHVQLVVWAIVDPKAPNERRRLQVVGTGQPIDPEGLRHINTVLDGLYVWHVFEEEK